jgi:hypothetical protein
MYSYAPRTRSLVLDQLHGEELPWCQHAGNDIAHPLLQELPSWPFTCRTLADRAHVASKVLTHSLTRPYMVHSTCRLQLATRLGLDEPERCSNGASREAGHRSGQSTGMEHSMVILLRGDGAQWPRERSPGLVRTRESPSNLNTIKD